MLAAVAPGYADLVGVRRLQLPGEGALLRQHVHLNSEMLFPVFGDHLRHAHELDELRGARADVQHEAVAVVGSQSEALRVLVGEYLVEHRVRPVRVERRPLAAPLGFGPRRVRVGRRGRERARHAESEEIDLVYLIAVDADGERAAEVHVAEQLADVLVLRVRHVELHGGVRPRFLRVEVELVAARFLVFEIQRHLRHVQVPSLPVVLARDGAQVDDFQVLGERQNHHVDVWQLVAVRVDHPEVRVALQLPRVGVDGRNRLPRRDDGQLGVERPVVLELEQVDPVVVALVLDHLRDGVLARHVGQELLEVVLGREQPVAVQPLIGVSAQMGRPRQHFQEEVVRVFELYPNGVVVHLRQRPLLAVDGEPG